MDVFLTEFQTNFYIGCLLLLSNIFIHLTAMIETETNPPTVDRLTASPVTAIQTTVSPTKTSPAKADHEPIAQHSEDLEFDCPSSFNFKDPNVDDLNTLSGRFSFEVT